MSEPKENDEQPVNEFDVSAALERLDSQGDVKRYANSDVEKALGSLLSLAPDISGDARVLYPGSAADSSFADVIGRNVVHIDPDADSMEALSSEGYVCICSTVEDYVRQHPELVDMVISYNAGTVSDELAARIRPGGYVIANNWHESANRMGERDDFEIVGAVPIGDEVVKDSETSRRGLGYFVCAISREGKMVTDEKEIAALEPETYMTMKEPRNTETLWLFKKSGD